MLAPSLREAPLPRLLALLAACLLVAAALLVPASPASAHDELIGSTPAAGATVDALPAELTLTFSSNISTEAGATEVQVTDAAGTSLLMGEPSVLDTVLTVPVEGAASGVVTVLWKVVSSDGHPISGQYAFTVAAAPPAPTETASPTETAAPAPTATTEPTEEPTASPTATPTATPDDEDSTFADVWPWVIGLLIFAAVGGAVIYLLVSRSRREKALAAGAAEGPAGGAAAGPEAGTGAGSEPPADR